MRMTHSVAVLAISPSSFEDISRQIAKVNHGGQYSHMFTQTDKGVVIDLTGIGVVADPSLPSTEGFIQNVIAKMEAEGNTSVTITLDNLKKAVSPTGNEIIEISMHRPATEEG